jgi:hypothetical protein
MNRIGELVALRQDVYKVSADGETFLSGRNHTVTLSGRNHTVSLGRVAGEQFGFLDRLAAGPCAAEPGADELVEALRTRGWLDITDPRPVVPLPQPAGRPRGVGELMLGSAPSVAGS